MAKTFKTIRPYTPPPPKPFTATDDGTSFVGMNFHRVPAGAAVIQDALKWWKADLAKNGMGADPMNPAVSVEQGNEWLTFKLDGHAEFFLNRNSTDLQCFAKMNTNSASLGTLLNRVSRWKRESKGTGPHLTPEELQILADMAK